MSSYKSWRGTRDVLESGGGFLQPPFAHGADGLLKQFIDACRPLSRGMKRPARYEVQED
jgi:hypothetical protein